MSKRVFSFVSLITCGLLGLMAPMVADSIPDFQTWADAVMHRLSGERYDNADKDGDKLLTEQEWLDELTDEEELYLNYDEADIDGEDGVTRFEAEIYTRDYRNLNRWYNQWIAQNN